MQGSSSLVGKVSQELKGEVSSPKIAYFSLPAMFEADRGETVDGSNETSFYFITIITECMPIRDFSFYYFLNFKILDLISNPALRHLRASF